MSLQSSVTTLSPLSPVLTYTPCITCDWAQGWIQGWNNTDRWDGSSVRYAEGWAVGQDLGVEWDFTGELGSSSFPVPSAYLGRGQL